MKIPKIKNLRKKIKDLPERLSQRAFLTFLVLFFLFLIFGLLIYYKYLILEEKKEPQILERVFEFDKNKFEKVLKILDQREKEFNSIDSKEFKDPFRSLPEISTSSIIFLPPL
jgi:uncharacterized membrane protein (DUF106 family)